jgi:hypothetical protein
MVATGRLRLAPFALTTLGTPAAAAAKGLEGVVVTQNVVTTVTTVSTTTTTTTMAAAAPVATGPAPTAGVGRASEWR